jgi:hypothetical protein
MKQYLKRAICFLKYDNLNIVFNTIANVNFIYLRPFTKKHALQLCQKLK